MHDSAPNAHQVTPSPACCIACCRWPEGSSCFNCACKPCYCTVQLHLDASGLLRHAGKALMAGTCGTCHQQCWRQRRNSLVGSCRQDEGASMEAGARPCGGCSVAGYPRFSVVPNDWCSLGASVNDAHAHAAISARVACLPLVAAASQHPSHLPSIPIVSHPSAVPVVLQTMAAPQAEEQNPCALVRSSAEAICAGATLVTIDDEGGRRMQRSVEQAARLLRSRRRRRRPLPQPLSRGAPLAPLLVVAPLLARNKQLCSGWQPRWMPMRCWLGPLTTRCTFGTSTSRSWWRSTCWQLTRW